MTSRPSYDRCEVCTARLDPERATGVQRCPEHVDQIALFAAPPAALLHRTGRRPSTSDTSGDRHHSRARRARTATKD